MFSRLYAMVAGHRAVGDRRLSDALVVLAEKQGRLAVDSTLLRNLGVGRTRFFRVLASLLMRERLFVFSSSGGGMELVANGTFASFTRQRFSGAPEARVASVPPSGREAGEGARSARAGRGGESLCDDTDSALFTGATLGGSLRDSAMPLTEAWDGAQAGVAVHAGYPGEPEKGKSAENPRPARRQRTPDMPYLLAGSGASSD